MVTFAHKGTNLLYLEIQLVKIYIELRRIENFWYSRSYTKIKKNPKKMIDKIWFRYFLWFCVFLLISVPSIAPPEAHEGQNAPDRQRDRRRNQLLRFFVRNWWYDLNKSNIHCKYFLHRWKNLNVPKRIQFIQMSKYKVCF